MSRNGITIRENSAQSNSVSAVNDHNLPIDKILSRLDGVRETGPGQWMALCPAHDDKNPSLSIREVEEGNILLNCFASCPAGDVLAAIGLTLADLFTNELPRTRDPLPKHKRRLSPRQALEIIRNELYVVLIASERADHGIALSEDDIDRLSQATGKIQNVIDEALL